MRLDIVSIFPEYFSPLDVSLIGKARERGTLDVRVHQLRDWTHDVHKTVDDTPYGGGPGMVMKPEVWGEAIDAIIADGAAANGPAADASPTDAPPTGSPGAPATGGSAAPGPTAPATGGPAAPATPRIIVPTPSGRPFTQEIAQELAAEPWLLFACGRYEGIDSRVMREYGARMRVDELSIGDYVLAGGEVAVLVMVEAVGRLLPGVLGNVHSAVDDSFAPGAMRNLLEGPVYTKPPVWRGHEVPEVLLSGHHGRIARWRRDEALRRTVANRPELAAAIDPETLDKHDRKLLDELAFRVGPEDMAN
ncbi:tRNA (guanosine(37)-N1)-methyltransferase TrmD [Nonomuraea sp. SMC257]|uniref:tRNA (guanine-N(1)-)-methyltransferase n=1 Tax=Nonomuraea montanisoli TaxID=2741721 RepID=A0A7Y6IGY1_9ACTN|nr:tRNA (guanosine(37)-N1)-methyltransferase TrmD [Nonomuraea montanisoli]NUW37947.1 tRNA (guanosine(37)-N1)-methyltransferase TrmD [Nonomuraea montanisoli]